MMQEDQTILVVDDDPTVQMITSKILSRDGVKVVTASDAATATAQINQHKPGVILMDIFLPGRVCGIELSEQISSGKFRYSPRVVFLTSCDQEDCRQKAMNSGAAGFITKPFDYDELSSTVETNIQLFFENAG